MVLVSCKLNSVIDRGTKPEALGWKPCYWTSTLAEDRSNLGEVCDGQLLGSVRCLHFFLTCLVQPAICMQYRKEYRNRIVARKQWYRSNIAIYDPASMPPTGSRKSPFGPLRGNSQR